MLRENGTLENEVAAKLYNSEKYNSYENFTKSSEPVVFGLGFSPGDAPMTDVIEKHKDAMQNISKLFVGGTTAIITPSEVDGVVNVRIHNETSRKSFMLHLPVENYERSDQNNISELPLSTTTQDFYFQMKVDKNKFGIKIPEKESYEKQNDIKFQKKDNTTVVKPIP
ncbi:MAG TPA: hypothetical protein VK498_06065 [Ferruginibacter sp.]|nr:hypothetical protein [Ferruginibacter sp.]